MNRPSLYAALLGTVFGIWPAGAQATSWQFHDDHVLGTSLDMIMVAAQESLAVQAADAARAALRRLDAVLSGWRDDSELAALNGAASLKASPDLFNLIALGESWRHVTTGAFSPRLGRLLAADAPSPDLAADIAAAPVTLDPAARVIVRSEAVQFAVDGIAKGYIVDSALEAARAVPGVTCVMIDIGGDLRCWGCAPGGDAWRIGVAAAGAPDNAPAAVLLNLADQAVATSGTGLRGNMLMEPATGSPVRHVVQATAIADRAADADALASAFAVMAPGDSIALADRLPGVAAQILAADGTVHASQGWTRLAQAQRPSAPSPSSWPADFSLRIDYEVPFISGGRRPHNPYVTLWITDAQGNLVRTLLFLAAKRRYIDENYVFWQRYGATRQALVESVTRPTRPPGRYSLVWDGLDDQGHPVPQGKYVLNVEAAREHGDHSLQHIDLVLGSSGMTAQSPAQTELGATMVTYGKNP